MNDSNAEHTPEREEHWKAVGTKALGLSEVIAPGLDCSQGHLVCSVNQVFYDRAVVHYLPRELTDWRINLIAQAPTTLQQRDKLLAVCKRLRRRAETGKAIQRGDVQVLDDAIANVEKGK